MIKTIKIIPSSQTFSSCQFGASEEIKYQPINIYKDILLSDSYKTIKNTTKDEQKYQPIFLLAFSWSSVIKSQVY